MKSKQRLGTSDVDHSLAEPNNRVKQGNKQLALLFHSPVCFGICLSIDTNTSPLHQEDYKLYQELLLG